MLISKIQSNYFTNYNNQIQAAKNRANNLTSGEKPSKSDFYKVPAGYHYGADIHFGEFFNPNRTVPHIDYEEYMAMSDIAKKRFRKRYKK